MSNKIKILMCIIVTVLIFATSYILQQEGIISLQECALLEKYEGYHKLSYDSEAAIKLRELLESKGIDGIIYDNGFEGDLSVIAFYPDQIYTVAENGVDLNAESKTADTSNYRCSIALPDTDTAAAIDREARAKSIVALAEGLQSVAESSSELEALERYKRNANILAGQYEQLNKLTAEYRELNNAPERDLDKLKAKREEIRALNESIDTNESGLKASRVTDTIRNMISRSVRRQGDEISKVKHQYYERQKARTESRKNTETKNKTLRQIQKLRNRLANPTKSRNVVNGMQDLASSALTLANAVFSGATNESIPNFPCFISLYFFSLHIVERGE